MQVAEEPIRREILGWIIVNQSEMKGFVFFLIFLTFINIF